MNFTKVSHAEFEAEKKNKPLTAEESTLKDSGQRREFDTGAVRDMSEGKGRCDLMPLDVVADIMRNPIIRDIAEYQETGDTKYLERAVIDFAHNRNIGLPEIFLEVSKHFEAGANKYGERNWQKGLPINCYIDSAIRHYLKHLRGDKDEPHDRAFVWNVICCIWTIKRIGAKNETPDTL